MPTIRVVRMERAGLPPKRGINDTEWSFMPRAFEKKWLIPAQGDQRQNVRQMTQRKWQKQDVRSVHQKISRTARPGVEGGLDQYRQISTIIEATGVIHCEMLSAHGQGKG
jgi:hypothetical protein